MVEVRIIVYTGNRVVLTTEWMKVVPNIGDRIYYEEDLFEVKQRSFRLNKFGHINVIDLYVDKI